MVKFKVGLLGLLMAQLAILAQADEGFPQVAIAENISELDYIGDVPKVLTVSRLLQPLSDAPSAVTIIDRETIRAAGIVDLPEIFRLVPGMYVGVNAGFVYSTNHAVSYHGATSAYSGSMQIMINGRSVYNPLFGGVNWSELPLAIADIDRIEVTRGPNAASYGANSYFGVINIITQPISALASNTVIATHGDGRNEAFYRHAGKMDDVGYRITAGYREDDGLENREDFKRTRFLNAQADYQINDKNNLEFEFGVTTGERREGNLASDSVLFLPRTKQIDNHYQLVRWRHHLSQESDLVVQAFHHYDASDDSATSASLRPAFANLVRADALDQALKAGASLAAATAFANAEANAQAALLAIDTVTTNNAVEIERYDLEVQHNFAIGQSIRAVWGVSVRQDSLYAPYFLGTSKTDYFHLQRIFGHVEMQTHEKVTLNAGAMMEHNDFTGTDVSPRASVSVKLNPNHTLRFGATSALKTPSYVEEKFQRAVVIPRVAPNRPLLLQQDANRGNLKPEKIVSREIAYLGHIGRLSIDSRLFYDTVSNHIRSRDRKDYVPPAGYLLLNPSDVPSYANEAGAKFHGFETQVKWQLSPNADVMLNYAHVRIRDDSPPRVSPDSIGPKIEYFNSMPSNTISALGTYQMNPYWDASLAYYQTSEVHALGDGKLVGLARRADVRVARQFALGRNKGEVSVMVENVFDSHYQEFADYNTMGRRARLNLKVDF